MAGLFGRATAFWRSRLGKYGSLFLVWFVLWIGVAIGGSDNSLAATGSLLAAGAMGLGFFLRSWWAETAQVPAPEDSFRDWPPSTFCGLATAVVSVAGWWLFNQLYGHIPGLLYNTLGENGPYWIMVGASVVPPIIVWRVFWKHWNRSLAAREHDAGEEPAEAKSTLIQVDRLLAGTITRSKEVAFVIRTIFVLVLCPAAIWYLAPWTLFKPENHPGPLAAAMVPIIWLFCVVIALAGVVNLAMLWDFIMDRVDKPQPLQDDKAHGAARTATRSEAELAARGGADQSAVHDQIFTQ